MPAWWQRARTWAWKRPRARWRHLACVTLVTKMFEREKCCGIPSQEYALDIGDTDAIHARVKDRTEKCFPAARLTRGNARQAKLYSANKAFPYRRLPVTGTRHLDLGITTVEK
ncbi:hypothetical protein [Novacetimonas maltaceti]|uniref:hypothetical protein n=1 Tax=Novacetimonas maltaceti TaxID=1203393 RepID=UPI0011AF0790|nr:hypothetical protein [Novacetimonas maltaceti]